MFHIVESCPLTKLNGGLSRLHSADEDQLWFDTHHAYEKKKIETGVVRRIRLSNGSTYCKYSQGLPFENER